MSGQTDTKRKGSSMRKKLVGLVAALATVAGGVVLLGSDPADAQRVANPGTVTFDFVSGFLQVGTQSFNAAEGDDKITTTGTITANGAFTATSMTFPPVDPIEGPFGNVNVTISTPTLPTGSLNPLTGAMNLAFSVQVNLSGGGVGSGCRIGPISISTSTANSGGVPYNTANGEATLSDHTFSVPASQNCGLAAGTIDDMVGLPSPSGSNHAVFVSRANPIVQAAIRPAFTATPSSGFAPLLVAFDGTTSFVAKTTPPPLYQWDFTNNGSFDAVGPTTAFTYLVPGTYTAKLRITDADGDLAETTRTVQVNQPFPNVTVDKTGSTTLIHGDAGSYTVAVTSTGDIPAVGATVVDTLPLGLTYTGSTSAGWSCAEGPTSTITCTSAEVVTSGSDFSDLVLDVVADGSFTGVVTNTATATTTGEQDPGEASNTDSADTLLVQPGIDLDIDKTHDADDGLFVGERATYILRVDNDGTATADERIRIVDVLPAGLDFVSASGGLDWVCSYDSPSREVRCFSDKDLDAGANLLDVLVRVDITGGASSPLTNAATVSVTGDANLSNNSDDDTGEVLGFAVDYKILKSHLGDVVVGEPSTYGIAVQNIGTANAGGTVTVTDQLPAGLTFVSGVGDGWTCAPDGGDPQLVTCEHAGGVEAGDVLPGISLQVLADASLIPSVTNTATVAGAGDANAVNDSSSVTSTVRNPQPDLTISKSHVGNFETGSNGSWTISVRNLAPERADGPTTVVDTLPAGVTYVSAAGTGWSCDAGSLPLISCTHAGTIAGLANAAPLTVTAFAPDGAPEIVVNDATVANAADTNGANNSAADPTRIDRRAQAPTTLEADAIVLRLNVIPLPRISISVLNAPYAVLTSDGEPVPGKLITFRTIGGQLLCSAVTNANGAATCPGNLATYLATLLQLRYTADFIGDFDYAPAHDEAAIIHVNGLKIL